MESYTAERLRESSELEHPFRELLAILEELAKKLLELTPPLWPLRPLFQQSLRTLQQMSRKDHSERLVHEGLFEEAAAVLRWHLFIENKLLEASGGEFPTGKQRSRFLKRLRQYSAVIKDLSRCLESVTDCHRVSYAHQRQLVNCFLNIQNVFPHFELPEETREAFSSLNRYFLENELQDAWRYLELTSPSPALMQREVEESSHLLPYDIVEIIENDLRELEETQAKLEVLLLLEEVG